MPISDALGILTTPESRAQVVAVQVAQIIISGKHSNVIVEVNYIDAGDATVRPELIALTTAQEVNDFITALGTVVANETGGVRRKTNFRALSHLLATGKLSNVSAVTP